MNLDKVLEIATECVKNESIPTEGLPIKYTLDPHTHKTLDQELFYKINNDISSFQHNDVIELTIGGVTFIFEIE